MAYDEYTLGTAIQSHPLDDITWMCSFYFNSMMIKKKKKENHDDDRGKHVWFQKEQNRK